MKNPKFQVYRSGTDFRFRLLAVNGENILYSEAYTSKSGCLNGIESVKTNSPYDNRYDRRISTDNKYYFVLRALNYEVIGTSQLYTTAQSREIGISAVKRDAPSAPIDDL
ncbi:MAG: YegP family protein, partial [Bacteroidota bacterium]